MTIITSYNLKWNSNNIEVNNILLNIKKIINTYDIDFFLFQEAAIYKKLILTIDKKKYKYHLHKSGEEYMITFYKINYEIINVYDSEFEPGRPFSLFLFNRFIGKQLFIKVSIIFIISILYNIYRKYIIIFIYSIFINNYIYIFQFL